jgi:DNA modification methylase
MRRPILNHTLQGDAVYDPFVGSGTTIIAAEMTGRRCYAIELSAEYCALSIARWEQHTGRKAKLVSRGA